MEWLQGRRLFDNGVSTGARGMAPKIWADPRANAEATGQAIIMDLECIVGNLFYSTSLRDIRSWVTTVDLKITSNRLREVYQVKQGSDGDDDDDFLFNCGTRTPIWLSYVV